MVDQAVTVHFEETSEHNQNISRAKTEGERMVEISWSEVKRSEHKMSDRRGLVESHLK